MGASFLLWFKRKTENPRHTFSRGGGRGSSLLCPLLATLQLFSISGIFPVTLCFCFVILWVWVFLFCVYLCTTCTQCPQKPEGVRPSRTRTTDRSSWMTGIEPSSSRRVPLLLFLSGESSLQPLYLCFYLHLSMLPPSDISRPFTVLVWDRILLSCKNFH